MGRGEPKYSYFLVQQYVEGRVAEGVVKLFADLDQFIQRVGPVIEQLNIELNSFWATQIIKLQPGEMDRVIGQDLEGCKKSMEIYNSVFTQFERGMLDFISGVDAEIFLKANEVPSDQIRMFREEIKLYWLATYGPLIDRLEMIRNLLSKMIRYLNDQYVLLSQIRGLTYLKGIEANIKISQLFIQEREAFNQIVELREFSNKDKADLRQLLAAKMSITRDAMKALIGARDGNDLARIRTAERNLRKAVIGLAFIFKVALIVVDLAQGRDAIIEKSTKKGVFYGLSRALAFFVPGDDKLFDDAMELIELASELISKGVTKAMPA